MSWDPARSSAPGPPRRSSTLDVDGTVAATFGLENGGRLPAPVPLREAVALLVDAWDEAADWSRYEAEAEPRDAGTSRVPRTRARATRVVRVVRVYGKYLFLGS